MPADKVLLHPGHSDTLSVYCAFVAQTTAKYSYTINLQSIGIGTTDGTRFTPLTSIGGVVALLPGGALPTYLSTGTLAGTIVLAAGEQFGVIIDRNTVCYSDSTSFGATVATVPEATTWAMVVAGFSLVGLAVHRVRSSSRSEHLLKNEGPSSWGRPFAVLRQGQSSSGQAAMS